MNTRAAATLFLLKREGVSQIEWIPRQRVGKARGQRALRARFAQLIRVFSIRSKSSIFWSRSYIGASVNETAFVPTKALI